MSRHILEDPTCTWEFGWNESKGLFFIEKYRKTRTGRPKKHRYPSPRFWNLDPMPEVEDFMRVAKSCHLRIPPEMRAQLYADKEEGR